MYFTEVKMSPTVTLMILIATEDIQRKQKAVQWRDKRECYSNMLNVWGQRIGHCNQMCYTTNDMKHIEHMRCDNGLGIA